MYGSNYRTCDERIKEFNTKFNKAFIDKIIANAGEYENMSLIGNKNNNKLESIGVNYYSNDLLSKNNVRIQYSSNSSSNSSSNGSSSISYGPSIGLHC